MGLRKANTEKHAVPECYRLECCAYRQLARDLLTVLETVIAAIPELSGTRDAAVRIAKPVRDKARAMGAITKLEICDGCNHKRHYGTACGCGCRRGALLRQIWP